MDLLLVEDKDSFRRLLSQALVGSPWKVEAVADPQAALRFLEARPFQVLVTELRLPGMSGLDMIVEARKIPGHRSNEIETILGYQGRAALVHRDDMVV